MPEAGRQALKSFGFEARKLIQDEMKSKYKHVTPYTLRSPYFKQNGLELTIGINDGGPRQSPAQYLFPTDRSGGIQTKQIKATTLAGAIRGLYGTDKVPVPMPNTRAGRQFVASNGNLKSMKVKSLLGQLNSPSASYRDQHFVLTERKGGLNPGIWRRYRVKNSVSLAFALLDNKPKQQTSIAFNDLVLTQARVQVPQLIQSKLRRLLG